MCGPLKLWKWIIYIAGIVFLGFGIAIMVVGVMIADKEFVEAIEIENLVKTFGIVFGVILILVGLIGWLAAKCQSRCLVCIVLLFHHIIVSCLHYSNNSCFLGCLDCCSGVDK